jgi:hypothetical protein
VAHHRFLPPGSSERWAPRTAANNAPRPTCPRTKALWTLVAKKSLQGDGLGAMPDKSDRPSKFDRDGFQRWPGAGLMLPDGWRSR